MSIDATLYSVHRYGSASVPRMKSALQAVKENNTHILDALTFSDKELRSLAIAAAGAGSLSVLEWFRKHHGRKFFNQDLCHTALRYQQLTALQWLSWYINEPLDQQALLQEARGYRGYEEIVRWLESITPRPTINN